MDFTRYGFVSYLIILLSGLVHSVKGGNEQTVDSQNEEFTDSQRLTIRHRQKRLAFPGTKW